MKYIALLRGVNVGGKNKVPMPQLKAAFEKAGFENVQTYINSGNVIFDSDMPETEVQAACVKLIFETFGLEIPVGIISRDEIKEALSSAPDWWCDNPDYWHHAAFAIVPATAQEMLTEIGGIAEEYEKVTHTGNVIFWSADKAKYSRTKFSKIVGRKVAYNRITVRNSNTARKLAELVEK